MRRGLFWSLVLHGGLLLCVLYNLPSLFNFNPPMQSIQVRLVTAPNPKANNAPLKNEPSFTQQSAAPAQPPKPKEQPKPEPVKKAEQPKPKPKPEAPKVVKKVEEKKPAPKQEQPKPTPPKEQAQKQPDVMPEKLDKSKDKQNIVKKEDAEPKPKTVESDDFLKALDFVESLKRERDVSQEDVAQAEGEKSEETTITLADQAELATIRRHIERNWLKPPGIQGAFEILIALRMNRDGTVETMRVVKSSGQAFFDNSLIRAVRKAEPLPIPAEKYDTFKLMEIYFNG